MKQFLKRQNELAAAATEVPEWVISGVLVYTVTIMFIPASQLFGNLPIYGSDHSSHYMAIRNFVELLRSGETSFFMHTFNLGFPMYLYYQPLPHLFTAALYALCFGLFTLQQVFNFSVAALWCLYPLSIYVGARRMGLDKLIALFCAVCAPMINSNLEFGFTIHSIMGPGLYTQLYATVAFPIALGSLCKAIDNTDRRSLISAAAWILILSLSHFFYGCVLSTVGVIAVFVEPKRWKQRLRRLLWLGLILTASLLFWLVPLALTHPYSGGWPFGSENRRNGYGVIAVLKSIFSGRMLDNWRTYYPLISIGFAVGVVTSLFSQRRKDPVRKLILICLAVFLFFLMGRRSFGPLVNIHPANIEFQLFRYIGAVHMFAVLLSGAGFAWTVRYANKRFPPLLVGIIAAALFFWPALKLIRTEKGRFKTSDKYSVNEPHLVDAAALINDRIAAGGPPGRIYAHNKIGTGSHFIAHALARHTDQPMGISYAVGLHDSLSFYYMTKTSPDEPKLRELFNFRYVISRKSNEFVGEAERYGLTKLGEAGPLVIYESPGEYSYFTPVTLSFATADKPWNVRPVVVRWIDADLPALKQYGLIVHEGPYQGELPQLRAHDDTVELSRDGNSWSLSEADAFLSSQSAYTSSTEITDEVIEANHFSANVVGENDQIIALKATFHPWWQLTVDGAPQRPMMLTPSFLGAKVPAGEHKVSFRFVNPPYQKALAGLTIVLWIVLTWLFWHRRPNEPQTPDAEPKPSGDDS